MIGRRWVHIERVKAWKEKYHAQIDIRWRWIIDPWRTKGRELKGDVTKSIERNIKLVDGSLKSKKKIKKEVVGSIKEKFMCVLIWWYFFFEYSQYVGSFIIDVCFF